MSMKEVSRQLTDLSAKVDNLATKVEGLDTKLTSHDAKFEAIENRFEGIDTKFDRIDTNFDRIDAKFDRIDARFEGLEKKMDDGFNASKIRDEELLGLSRLCLEADEVLRDSMVRRFDETDRKNDEQIGLLMDVVRHLGSHK